MPGFCARTNGFAKRTAYSGIRAGTENSPGDCFPPNVGGAKKSGDVLRGSKAVRYRPDLKTIRGIVLPAIEYNATYRGA
jgi:hypothetical protein